MTTGGMERRRAPRVDASLPIQIGTRQADAAAQLKDISQNGLCCSFGQAIPEMTIVRVDLLLPGQRAPHAVQGVVVRCGHLRGTNPPSYDLGVYFTEISPEGRAAIAAFVAQRSAGQPATRPIK